MVVGQGCYMPVFELGSVVMSLGTNLSGHTMDMLTQVNNKWKDQVHYDPTNVSTQYFGNYVWDAIASQVGISSITVGRFVFSFVYDPAVNSDVSWSVI